MAAVEVDVGVVGVFGLGGLSIGIDCRRVCCCTILTVAGLEDVTCGILESFTTACFWSFADQMTCSYFVLYLIIREHVKAVCRYVRVVACYPMQLSAKARLNCGLRALAKRASSNPPEFRPARQQFRQPTTASADKSPFRLQVRTSRHHHPNERISNFLTELSYLQTKVKPPTAIMSHESVWYSRPRTYGKGSREWCVVPIS